MIEREAVSVNTSPLGHTIGAARRRRAATNPEYRRAYDALTVPRQVAQQVLEYRLDHGLTQQQLAESTGTSLPQISRIESGVHNPTLKTLQRLAEVMGKQLTVSFVDAVVDDSVAPTDAALPAVTQKTTPVAVVPEHNRLTVAKQDTTPAWTVDFHQAMAGATGNQRKPVDSSGPRRKVAAA